MVPISRQLALLLVVLVASSAWSQERGIPIFSDSFDTPNTFAENWIPKGSSITSEGGKIVFTSSGTLDMRSDTPLEFYVEMDITLDMSHKPDKSTWDQAFCGFLIEGFHFLVLPAGNTWMIYKLEGQERSHGKQVKIDNFAIKKPVRLTLVRKVANNVATYQFNANGKDAGSFVHAAPLPVPVLGGGVDTYKPLEIFSYNVHMTVDNYSLSTVKHSTDDSPNVIINSSFEQAQGGYPLYFPRSSFNLSKATTIPYEDFLATWSLDTSEKHSGNQSLKMVFDESMSGQRLWAWGAGTVKGSPGVFSVWMKADREAFPVQISYGKRREVMVGTSWKRYEVMNPELPGAGVYSPVTISFRKKHGTLWVDDLQAEFIDKPEEMGLEEAVDYATPYKPSELDKQRFGKQTAPERAPEFTISKLPIDLKPQGDLDAWKDNATQIETFYFKDKPARNKTEVYLACDDNTLYIGYRCFVNDLGAVYTQADPHDSFRVFSTDSVEFLLDPAANGTYCQFAAGAGGTRLDIGHGGDVSWNGDWTSAATLNDKAGSIDYLITVPFSTLASASMSSRWLVNFCRNDSATKEQVAIAPTPILGFKKTGYWPYAQLPPDVVARYSVGVTSAGYADDSDGMAAFLEINNLTGAELKVKAELVDAQNSAGTLVEKEITLKKGANDFTFHSRTKATKARLKLSVDGAPLADQTFPLEKRNPVSMLGRLNYYMTEKEAVFRVSANLPELGKTTATLTIAGKSVELPAAAEFDIAAPLKDVPDGEHTAILTLTKDGQKVAETTAKLVKRPYKKGATQVSHFTRSLIHDGQPILPFSPFFVFSKHQPLAYAVGAIDFADRYGFRFVHILVDNRALDQALAAIKHAQHKGIKVLLWTKYYELTDEECDELRAKLDLPNVFSQMVLDEPELGMPSEDARAYLSKMRAKFPYQPVQMNNTVLGIPNRYANLETDVLMLDDYLTNNENRTVASVVDATDIMRQAGAEDGKPCYYFVVAGNFPLHYREPSYSEQIAQTYGNIAAGCTGLSFFYGVPATPGNWQAYIQLNREVLALSDVLLSEEEIGTTTCSADPKILRNLTKRNDGFVYVVACNIDAKPMGKSSFALPAELQYADQAEVMFEDRTVPVSGGRFIDDFSGHTRHVYKVKIR